MSEFDDPKKPGLSATREDPARNARDGRNSGSTPLLGRSVQVQLGQRLRHFYESLALGEQPVPDRFIDIINRLDQQPLDQGYPEKPQ
jgi:hypothetical protein